MEVDRQHFCGPSQVEAEGSDRHVPGADLDTAASLDADAEGVQPAHHLGVLRKAPERVRGQRPEALLQQAVEPVTARQSRGEGLHPRLRPPPHVSSTAFGAGADAARYQSAPRSKGA